MWFRARDRPPGPVGGAGGAGGPAEPGVVPGAGPVGAGRPVEVTGPRAPRTSPPGEDSEVHDVPGRPRRARLVVWAQRGLLVLVLAATAWAVVGRWSEVSAALVEIPWYVTALSSAATVVGILVGTLAWQAVVDDLGPPVGLVRGAQINLVGQLGKYVPGTVWAYLLQMELGRRAGLPRARIFSGSLIHLGVSMVASLLLGVLAAPVLLADTPSAAWLYLLLPVGLVALHPAVLTRAAALVFRVLRRPPPAERLRWGTVGRVLGLSLTAYGLFGVHLWLLASASGAVSGWDVLVCVGAMAIGMNAGILVFFLPSGAVVRDAILLAALLAAGLTEAQAIAFTLASRLMFVLADVLTAGGAALTARLALRRAGDD